MTIERLVEEYETAKATSDAELRGWASQHLNIEIGLALSADGWAGAGSGRRPANAEHGRAPATWTRATWTLLARCEVAWSASTAAGWTTCSAWRCWA
jgi:hypothetical protein